jgi:hypothetical protein
VGLAHVETAWGLYLFTACILASLGLSVMAERHPPPGSAPPG